MKGAATVRKKVPASVSAKPIRRSMERRMKDLVVPFFRQVAAQRGIRGRDKVRIH